MTKKKTITVDLTTEKTVKKKRNAKATKKTEEVLEKATPKGGSKTPKTPKSKVLVE